MTVNSIDCIAEVIVKKLKAEMPQLKQNWAESTPVMHVIVDNLLPLDLAIRIAEGFPSPSAMRRAATIRERKYTSADYREWSIETQNAFLALQHASVLEVLSELTGILSLKGDTEAYAGGISIMGEGDFLNPHLDNSTHPSIAGYRRLNSLFYIGENWEIENGGNLELWSARMKDRTEVCSAFNRLVIMNTNRKSLHSVNKVVKPGKLRKCLSNYYFTAESPDGSDYHHVTSFRGRPDEPVKDAYLRVEGFLASKVQAIVGKPLKKG